ncbi:MAG: hypothetical protein JXA94_06465 [Parachlamydiales bacterium]|nr:hypothetical protein [Parachlamydiales bacterium]
MDEYKISELKKAIKLIEWDLANITNNEIRQFKEYKLKKLKSELSDLLAKQMG